jgi:hypothetical protein
MACRINRLFVYLHIMRNALQRYSKDSKIKKIQQAESHESVVYLMFSVIIFVLNISAFMPTGSPS